MKNDVMRFFILRLTLFGEGNVVRGSRAPQRSNMRRNGVLGSGPGKSSQAQEHDTNCPPLRAPPGFRGALPTSRDHALLHENAEPPVKGVLRAQLKGTAGLNVDSKQL